MLLALVGVIGVVIGAMFTSLFHHWEWLRERRLNEYSDLLTAFRVATAESSKATQGRMIYTDPENNPEDRTALHKLVVAAWDAGDQVLAAKDRVDLIATWEAKARADDLGLYVMKLRMIKPLSDGDDAVEVDPDEFPKISRDGHGVAEAFKSVALTDVGNMSSRSRLWSWLRELVSRSERDPTPRKPR